MHMPLAENALFCCRAQVCDKGTGHAEVVAVTFDPSVVTFRDLLDVFFTIHDPTTPNRQGADVGPQYRSIILYTNEEQKRIAEEVGFDAQCVPILCGSVVAAMTCLVALYGGHCRCCLFPRTVFPCWQPGLCHVELHFTLLLLLLLSLLTAQAMMKVAKQPR
jgi:hypothetical protein